jgi:hypothetical protein
MRCANRLGILVCATLLGSANLASADDPIPPARGQFPASASAGGAFANDAPVRDLTPAGFADIVPPPDPHHDAHAPHYANLGPCAPAHSGWYVSAEYLLLRPRAEGYDFALRNAPAGLATVGPIEPLKSALGSGLRAEGGYRFANGWEAGFAYTFLNSGGNRTLSAGTGGVLYPTVTRPGLTDAVLFAAASNELNYNLYDFVIGRRWAIDETFAVRAFAGVRYADIGRKFEVGLDGLDANLAAVRSRSGFDGFGPIIGGEAVAAGPYGLHLYSRATGGLITGRSTNRLVETNNAEATVYVNTRYDVRKVVPVASLAVGGGWQYRTVSIRGGYEITHWSGFGEPIRFVDDLSQGKIATRPAALSLEGFFFQVGLSF